MQNQSGGAQVYDAPDVDRNIKPAGGAMAYDLPPRSERKTIQGGAMAFDAPTAPLQHPAPRIQLADMNITPSPIARTVIEAAAYARSPMPEPEPYEPTIRMAIPPPRQNRLGLREAEIARKRRFAFAGIALLAPLTTLGVLLRPHNQAVTAEMTEGPSARPAYATRIHAVTAAGGTAALASATNALPAPKPARTVRHKTRRNLASPVPTETKTAAIAAPPVSTHTAHVTPRTAAPAPQSRAALSSTAAPVTSRAAVTPPAALTPEILPDDTPETPAVHTQTDTPAPAPRRHHRRHHRNPSPAPSEQRRRSDSDIKAEFARHPTPGYDEKADRWMDDLPDNGD